MKPDKRKLAVIGVLLVIVAFIITYSIWLLGDDSSESENLNRIDVPELNEEKREFHSRLEAVDNLSEKKPVAPPGLYDEDLIDDQGSYDPYLEEKEKVALMDSILNSGPDMEDYGYDQESAVPNEIFDSAAVTKEDSEKRVLGQGHAEFFLSPEKTKIFPEVQTIRVEVNGDQTVRKDERLELRLVEPVIMDRDTIPENTLLYGFCSFQPNRLLLKVPQLGGRSLPLEAFDLMDGQKGLYIQNSFRSQATTQIIDDVIQDMNVSGLPQVSGLKGIFQRSNRSVKVKVLHQYQLYLKPVL